MKGPGEHSSSCNFGTKSKELDLEKIKGSNKLFKFDTNFQDYATFQTLIRFFGSAANNLVHHDSDTNHEKVSVAEYKKRCPKRRFDSRG